MRKNPCRKSVTASPRLVQMSTKMTLRTIRNPKIATVPALAEPTEELLP